MNLNMIVPRTISRQIILFSVIFVTAMLLFDLTDIDVNIQDGFFIQDTKQWVVDRKDPVKSLICYKGIKVLLVVFGISCLFVTAMSGRITTLGVYRRSCFLMAASLIIVPAILSGSRNFTNVYCPRQLERYGGDKPYVKLLQRYPPGTALTKPGKCFPAGHASGGFALMMGLFVFERKKTAYFALVAALGIGWMMGLYQMLNGAHFLSHTVASMIGAWVIILTIVGLTDRWIPVI